ncbi:MAG: hypothetical protein KKB50_17160 [Planctomycetes bacterium]|nr:hypothetical protein [Planctomycetota bacterium]
MLLALLVLPLGVAAQTTPATSRATTSASHPAPAAFQPGVTIDWREHVVRVAGRVVLRHGPLEFLACFAGKEHESIVRLDASATHIYMALGLVGITPGHPPQWDERGEAYVPPTGDLVELSFEWLEGHERRSANAFQWLRDAEFGRIPHARPWVFAGSVRLPDDTLLADHSGVGVAVVDFADSLICLFRRHSSADAALWLEANTNTIPPLETPVWLAVRAAEPRSHLVEVDFRGAVFVDGRYASLSDLAESIATARRLDPAYVQTFSVAGTLTSDVAQLRHELGRLGIADEALRFAPMAAATRPVGGAQDSSLDSGAASTSKYRSSRRQPQ